MKKTWKAFSILYYVACFMLLLTRPAHAYIDPSVTTYAVQAIAGVAVAIGAFVTIYWRRAKKKINKSLGIDENAKKEMEAEIVEYDADEESRKEK